ncbi:SUN domain-containing protein 4-like [Cucurbita moschata]|uniref:SUN domain-containing protein 4-like n=1 Tax=Cucurbita moschata TaxID=3662 RepID=A0A6J1FK04_CUCMO|nr:SUN domain-containing protein 4-like [Cucurbita moschata]XP_022938506.1 SUN domain-containing protein 4-like [Cucurbita moschata]XP_022938507.1 SUN domain-containing protein 4-like [Cucurbita moschata]XP_022938508.1 SUN domain-containing protein 4-like [Cucurbita moschata]XP_022938509.1 SUN domain-containing protein 4-like [Cucurbita moschata]XP_022938510.1 SUN domain-containing protein 4-like [Cucurbita moschata]XP_022938511.1 SUN domain-containing protein 4-like [Cucurbita moschata]XP_0
MQRSRRALLQRRALEKTTGGRNGLYMFSLSLLFVLWGLFFLLSLWIRQGNSRGDGCTDLPDSISTWNKSTSGSYKHSEIITESRQNKNCSVALLKDRFIDSAESIAFDDDIVGREENVNHDNFDEDVHLLAFGEQPDEKKNGLGRNFQTDSLKADRLSHVLPLGLEVFKSRAFISETKTRPGQLESAIHRLEPSGAEYNYAAASKGSKVLGFNKEAKGASNILGRDTDKYLRNPCSAEEKFVTMELSEETLVRTIKIANFEHHSSNLKEFELLGSSVYPTDVWVKLGNFTAANAKHAQRFVLEEPKWARYLKLRLLSHHGSEFYCTLSVFEVYGLDAVEEMLEDLVSVHDNTFISTGLPAYDESTAKDNDEHHNYDGEISPLRSDGDIVQDLVKHDLPERFQELRHHQAGRMPGDTVLKILMQKVRSSELSLSILERYLEELNSKYGNIFRQFNDETRENELLLQKSREDIRNLLRIQESAGRDVRDLISWRSFISLQLDSLLRDNAILRSEIEKVEEKQISLENQSAAVVFVCMIFLLFTLTRLFLDMVVSVYTGTSMERNSKSGKFRMNTSWILLLLSCSFFIFILLLF